MRAILALTLVVLGANSAVQDTQSPTVALAQVETASVIAAPDTDDSAAAPRGDRLDIVASANQDASPYLVAFAVADAAPDTVEIPATASLLSPVPDGLIIGPDSLAIRPGDAPNADAKPADGTAPGSRELPLDQLCQALLTSAEDNDLPVPFFANLIWQESRLRDDTVSRAGALGIAQFMPRVAAETGLDDPFDPRQALPASARLLHMLRDHFGNLGFVAAAYNAGARRVSEWLQHHRALPRETRDYVVKVTGRSAEQWRATPVQDDNLTFVRHLPCRDLPAFADVEQARQQQAQAEQAKHAPAKELAPKLAAAAAQPEKNREVEVADRRRDHDRHHHHDIRVAGPEAHEEHHRASHVEHTAHERSRGEHREKGRSKAA